MGEEKKSPEFLKSPERKRRKTPERKRRKRRNPENQDKFHHQDAADHLESTKYSRRSDTMPPTLGTRVSRSPTPGARSSPVRETTLAGKGTRKVCFRRAKERF